MKITPVNLSKQKISDVLDMVIEDVKKVLACGIILDMSTWAANGEDGKVCTACLGGSALLGFTEDVCTVDEHHYGALGTGDLARAVTTSDIGTSNLKKLAYALNAFREGDTYQFFDYFQRINPKSVPKNYYEWIGEITSEFLKRIGRKRMFQFSGRLGEKKIKTLLSYITAMAELLREKSY